MNKIGLTSNKLKIIAIITMIIDHIGYYFYYLMSDSVYLACRIVGRISMPIFVFLLVQGYCKTSNVKRYVFRIFKYAIITQALISCVYLLNYTFVHSYSVGVYAQLNILFSFCLSLALLYLIDKNNSILNSNILNSLIKIFVITIIILIYLTCNIDYKFIIPIMAIALYINEIYNSKEKRRYTYKVAIILIIFACGMLQNDIGKLSILSALFIPLYNGELGKKNIVLKRIFYIIFPLQHFILYLISLLLLTNN